jgi:hypothetical protein
MTHDELTARLRAADHDTNEAWPAMVLAANQLDCYLHLLRQADRRLSYDRQSDADLIAEIQEAIK